MKQLLKQLICSAPTAENGELRCGQTLKAFFDRSGIGCRMDCWGRHANLLARLPSSGERGALLFACHLDVVPAEAAKWSVDPFEAVEKDGKIYGRGAVDMLSGITAAAAAMAEIKNAALAGDVVFAATSAEETDSCGAKRFIRNDGKSLGTPYGVIVTEPTGMRVMRAHKGILWIEITCTGRAAHGSMPHLGVNAIDVMRRFLNRLDQYKISYEPHSLLGGCTLSVNKIVGGAAPNIVPDRCTVSVDIRTLPDQPHNKIRLDIEKILKQLKTEDPGFDADVSVIRSVPALETDADNPFVKSVCSVLRAGAAGAVGFTTDGPWFAGLGGPVVILGPGQPGLCHTADEYIDTEQLEKAKDTYKKLILSLQA